MKKLFAVLFGLALLASCGDDKKKNAPEIDNAIKKIDSLESSIEQDIKSLEQSTNELENDLKALDNI